MRITLQQLFQSHFFDYAQTKKLPKHHYTAANKIMTCRTAALGGHAQHCENGHTLGVWYNSCRHRSCTQCQFIQAERWLEKQKALLLDTSHRHIVFTIPHEFHGVWRFNTTGMIDVLFSAVRETLMQLCQQEAHLGALPGFMLALHTWGRSLSLHPHIHCLVTEGGVDEQGAWRTPRRNSFLPAKVVMIVFRGKFLASIRGALDEGKLCLPPDVERFRFNSLLNKLGRKKWNVRVMERYAHGGGVATYLSRYVRGGPISDQQVAQLKDHTIGFSFSQHHDGQTRPARLEIAPYDFIDRYLTHVPPKGKPVVRCYGLYAGGKRDQLNAVRAQFQQGPVQTPPPVAWKCLYQRVTGKAGPVCPECGAPVHMGAAVPPRVHAHAVHDPPQSDDARRAA